MAKALEIKNQTFEKILTSPKINQTFKNNKTFQKMVLEINNQSFEKIFISPKKIINSAEK